MRVAMLGILSVILLFGCNSQTTSIRSTSADEAPQDIRSSEDLASDNQLLEGKAQYLKGDYRQACKHLIRAVSNNQRNWEAQYYFGLSQQKLGMDDRAVTALTAALRYCPSEQQTVARINYALGVSLEAQGYLAKAKEQYTTATTLWPDFAEAQAALARVDAKLEIGKRQTTD